MRSTMTVRNDSFLRSRIRVKKAPGGASMANKEAVVGSVRAARHTGWAEQEGLKPDNREKVITPLARGGSNKKRVRPAMRMKKGKKHPRPGDFKGSSARHRATVMLQTIGRTRSKKPFVIHGHPKISPGLWRFGRGSKGRRKLEPLQLFKEKPATPVRNLWMTKSVDRYFRKLDKKRVWGNIIKRADALPKRR